MYQAIIVVHVLLGLGVIGLVLMQQGKGADAGAAFGSGSSGSVFGAQGSASFLSRTTAVLAALFFATSLGLTVLGSHRETTTDLMSTPDVKQDKMVMPEGLPDVDASKVTEVPAMDLDHNADMKSPEPEKAMEDMPKSEEAPKSENLMPQDNMVKEHPMSEQSTSESTPVEKAKTEKKMAKKSHQADNNAAKTNANH
jgi:preprotein translocase subunit SecG